MQRRQFNLAIASAAASCSSIARAQTWPDRPVKLILAHPAGHVGAPRHYTPYFRDNGLDWHMVPLDIAPEHLTETIRVLAKSSSVAGINLTMPHKPAAFELCDAVGPAAKFEGVVNTIRIETNGRLVGESFDGGGFLIRVDRVEQQRR